MTKKAFKIFWAWQDDAEEKWLRKMSKEGWGLKHYNWFIYTFEQIQPTDYVYKLDYKGNYADDLQTYISLFEDSGWEHVDQFQNWHYFRTVATSTIETPDIYSDTESKVKKYEDLSNVILTVLLSIITIFFIVVLPADFSFMKVLQIIYVVLIGLNLFTYVSLRRKVNRLKQEKL